MTNPDITLGLNAFYPEIFLTLLTVIILISGLYSTLSKTSWWIAACGVVACILYSFYSTTIVSEGLIAGVIENDQLSVWFKAVLMTLTFLLLLFYGGMTRVRVWTHGFHEYVVIILIATIGGMIVISARNLLVLYIALELISLSSYILASYDREQSFSAEAGMKYFILGSLSSCIMVFGMSFIYGFSGTLSYSELNQVLSSNSYSIGLIAGIFMFLIGILFKLSVFPFHFWTQDIYQGSPFISVAFFTSIPKFVTVVALINIINLVIADIYQIWQDLFIWLAILSMIVGGIGAIPQTSFKRLMGYSTVLNLGFVLLALSTNNSQGFTAALIYQILYSVASIGLFATLSMTIAPDADDYNISCLAGFGVVKKLAAFSISIFMFSFVGIPPLAGFFAKFNIITASIGQYFYIASVVALLISVISAYYYINIVRIMYFAPPSSKALRLHESSAIAFVISVCVAITILFAFLQYW